MSKNSQSSRRLSRWLPPLLGIFLFSISVWTMRQELQQYSFRDELKSLLAIPLRQVFVAIGLTALNYVALTGYDTLAVRYIQRPLAYCKTALVAVVACAVSNSVGLSLLSGSAVRYRFYSGWGLSAIEIAHVVAFCSLSFWLGPLAVGSVVFLISPVTIPVLLHLPFNSVHAISIIFLIGVAVYLLWHGTSKGPVRVRSFVFPRLSIELALGQIAIASLDWMLTAAILYSLLPSAIPLSYSMFLGIYLLAQIAGIISNVPGGLGVFETAMLLMLSPLIPPVNLFAALLAYRGIYFFLPLGFSAMLMGIYELRQRWVDQRS